MDERLPLRGRGGGRLGQSTWQVWSLGFWARGFRCRPAGASLFKCSQSLQCLLAFLAYPFFFLLLLLFHLVSFHLNTMVLMEISDTFFSLLQSEPMVFFALILSVPEMGSPGADPAPLTLQLPALPAELLQLQILMVLQPLHGINDSQFLWTFTWVIIDNFILFIFYKSFNRVQLCNK